MIQIQELLEGADIDLHIPAKTIKFDNLRKALLAMAANTALITLPNKVKQYREKQATVRTAPTVEGQRSQKACWPKAMCKLPTSAMSMNARRRSNADIEIAHQSTLLCHLGNIAYRTSSILNTNSDDGHITENSAAAAMWSREYAKDWEPTV